MSLITDALGGTQIKAVAMTIVITLFLAGIAGVAWRIHSLKGDVATLQTQVTTLTANNKIIQENNDVLKSDLIAAQDVNATDNKTITDLLNERNDAKTAVDTLSAQSRANKQVIGTLQSNLDNLRKNPANDGVLSKDLRETIRGIQNSGGQK